MWWKQYKDTDYEVHKLGLVRNRKTGKILSEHLYDGHIRVQLYIDKVKKNRPIHILTAELWVNKDKQELNIVNHENTIKIDPYYRNLEWTTISGNTKHAVENGLIDMAYVNSFRKKKNGESISSNNDKQ